MRSPLTWLLSRLDVVKDARSVVLQAQRTLEKQAVIIAQQRATIDRLLEDK